MWDLYYDFHRTVHFEHFAKELFSTQSPLLYGLVEEFVHPGTHCRIKFLVNLDICHGYECLLIDFVKC